MIPTDNLEISDKIIGQGASGKVYAGVYAGTKVAVKILDIPMDENDLDHEMVLLL